MASKKKKTKKALKLSAKATPKTPTFIIVGGAEDKTGDMVILRKIAEKVGKGKLIIATLASAIPEELWIAYQGIFAALDVKQIEHFHLEQPGEINEEEVDKLFKEASGIFFTGGDQLKITTKIGGTCVVSKLFQLIEKGGVIAGTSAGASIMGEIMLVGSESADSHKVGSWMMAPALRFVENLIIDQHFAQRGRIGRLLGAVAINPGFLGLGIDEGTAIIVENDRFKVIGENAVYIVDGRNITYTNISEARADKTMSVHDVKLHILADGESFDLSTRQVFTPAGN